MARTEDNGIGDYYAPSLYAPDLRDGTTGPLYRESVTSCFPVITTDHAFIHEGIAFTLSGTVTVDTAWSMSFVTPAEGYVHFKPTGITAAGGPVTVTFLEGSTFTGGDVATPVNRNRVGTPTASTVAAKTGVTPTGGTTIATLFIPSATNGSQRVGSSTEAATGTVACGYDLFWYEEESA